MTRTPVTDLTDLTDLAHPSDVAVLPEPGRVLVGLQVTGGLLGTAM